METVTTSSSSGQKGRTRDLGIGTAGHGYTAGFGHGHGHGHGSVSGSGSSAVEALSFDGKNFRYHLHWELYGLHQETHPVVGFCRSGELFGILSFGEIKTNMLKSLSGVIDKSKDSKVTLFASGKVDKDSWSRSSHLCPSDDDILYRNLTVIETLLFSSELRVSRHGHDEITALRLLTAMELDHISDSRISSLTAWQRRMVVFATEIVAGQDLIFFDKPTLDLDATSALACVTALQRVARTGVLVAITSDFLSFREYAILDRIQLLTSTGSIFFGAGARAISFFEQFGRTPSPGASIPDFLFYLVDDINSGFLDGTNIIKANNIQSRNICKHVDNYIKRISASAQDESKIFSGSSSFLQQFHDPRSAGFGKWHGSDSLYSGSPEAVSSGANNVIIKSLLDSLEWIRGCGCLTMEEEDACVQPRISKQFTWCLWRACSIRARNVNHLTGLLGMIGLLLPIGLVTVFYGNVSNATEIGILNYCMVVTIFPYCISLFGVIWNEDDVRDRIVFSFERSRGYYFASHFPVSAVIADVCVFKLFPVVVACIILIPFLNLQRSFMSLVRMLHALFLVTVVSTCLSKSVFNVLSYNSTQNISNRKYHASHSAILTNGDNIGFNFVTSTLAAKAALVSVFWVTIQLLYSGLFVCFAGDSAAIVNRNWLQSLLSNVSMFKWVCGALYWEIEDMAEDDMSSVSLSCIRGEVIEPGVAFARLWLIAACYLLLSTAVTIVFHK